MLGSLVSTNMCSYKDLKESLTLEDAYRLSEILVIKDYNNWASAKSAEERNG